MDLNFRIRLMASNFASLIVFNLVSQVTICRRAVQLQGDAGHPG
jgi:hypothetical protein